MPLAVITADPAPADGMGPLARFDGAPPDPGGRRGRGAAAGSTAARGRYPLRVLRDRAAIVGIGQTRVAKKREASETRLAP